MMIFFFMYGNTKKWLTFFDTSLRCPECMCPVIDERLVLFAIFSCKGSSSRNEDFRDFRDFLEDLDFLDEFDFLDLLEIFLGFSSATEAPSLATFSFWKLVCSTRVYHTREHILRF